MSARLKASGVEMSGARAGAHRDAGDGAAEIADRARRQAAVLVERGDDRRRQDQEIGGLAAGKAFAQGAGGAEIQIEPVAAEALELFADGFDHGLHRAGAHDFDGGQASLPRSVLVPRKRANQ